MGGVLQCRLDTSVCHLLVNNLNQLNKRILWCELQQWANRKAEYKKIQLCAMTFVCPFLWCYRVFHELKYVEKLREHVEGVMDENFHCAGSIIT